MVIMLDGSYENKVNENACSIYMIVNLGKETTYTKHFTYRYMHKPHNTPQFNTFGPFLFHSEPLYCGGVVLSEDTTTPLAVFIATTVVALKASVVLLSGRKIITRNLGAYIIPSTA